MSKDVSSTKKVRIRIAKAAEALSALNDIWKKYINRKRELSLFRSNVHAVLKYSSESWYRIQVLENTMNTFKSASGRF